MFINRILIITLVFSMYFQSQSLRLSVIWELLNIATLKVFYLRLLSLYFILLLVLNQLPIDKVLVEGRLRRI